MIEAYQPKDAGEVAALFCTVPEVPGSTEDSFRAFTQMSFNRGARDFKVVRQDGRIVAALTSTLLDGCPPIRHFRIIVAPEYRRRGIAAKLMAEVESQEGAEVATLQSNSQRSWDSGNGFLTRCGFVVARRELLMRLPSSHRLEEPRLAPGISLRPATRSDDQVWRELHELGFSGNEGYIPLLPDDLEEERMRPGFTLTLAEAGGAVVGYGHGLHDEGDEGLLNNVVVRPSHRGRGIGDSLVRATVGELRTSGCTDITLNVMADNEPAVHLYQRLGFIDYDEILTFQRRMEHR